MYTIRRVIFTDQEKKIIYTGDFFWMANPLISYPNVQKFFGLIFAYVVQSENTVKILPQEITHYTVLFTAIKELVIIRSCTVLFDFKDTKAQRIFWPPILITMHYNMSYHMSNK